MVVVDAHSKWLEVILMSSTTAEKTIAVLRNLFASYGLPEQLVSDNGPQFTANEFSDFIKANRVKHIRTAPYHPASNGEAERFVQTFKHSLKAGKNGWNFAPEAYQISTHRSTPHSTAGISPAKLFLKRQLRTRLDILRPSLERKVAAKQAEQKNYHDAHSKAREFLIGQTVLAQNLQGEPKWLKGTVLQKTGPVSYKVQVGDRIWRRHVDQLLSAESDTKEQTSSDDYVHTSIQTEQARQNEEQQHLAEDPEPQDPNVTEPPDTNFETAAGTAHYPTRTHHPRVFSYHLLVVLKLEM